MQLKVDVNGSITYLNSTMGTRAMQSHSEPTHHNPDMGLKLHQVQNSV